MAKCKFKIMIKISEAKKNNFVELTSSILHYTGKKSLEKYPIFYSNLIVTSEWIDKIRVMDYNKRLELFFDSDRYKSFFGPEPKLKQEQTNDSINRIFEFTLQAIFPIGFPIKQYHQTMEAYDSSVERKSVRMNGYTSLSQLMSPSDSFSYVTFNKTIYTVMGITWLNDAFCHPLYKHVINSYELFQAEKKEAVKTSKIIGKNIDNLIYNLIVDIFENSDTWKDTRSDSGVSDEWNRTVLYNYRQSEDSENTRKKMKEIIASVRTQTNDFLNNYKLVGGNLPQRFIEFLKQNKEFTEEINKSKNPNKKMKELIIDFEEELRGNAFLEGGRLLQQFRQDVKTINNDLRQLISNTKLHVFESLSSSLLYRNALVSYVKKVQELTFREEIYEIVIHNMDYKQSSNPYEVEKIIKKDFIYYDALQLSFIDLEKSRKISNNYWRDAAKTMVGSGGKYVFTKEGKVNSKGLLDDLLTCKGDFGVCSRNKKYINVGIDELKTNKRGNEDSALFEAYVHLNVLEGEITKENYKSAFCSLADNVFGNLLTGSTIKKNAYVPYQENIFQIKK